MHQLMDMSEAMDRRFVQAAVRCACVHGEGPDPRRLRTACLLVYAGLLLTLGALFAAGPAYATADAYLTVQRWDVDDGLAQNSVQAMDRDARGYLWVGTVDGLSRFDGATFRNYRLMDYPDLGSNRIAALAATSDGAVWIGTEHRGLVRFRDDAFRALPVCGQRCQVFDLALGPADALWMLASSGLYRLDSASGAVRAQVDLALQATEARNLVPLDDGRVAYASGDAILVHDRDGAHRVTWTVPGGGRIRGLARVGDRLLAATADGLLVLDESGLRPASGTPAVVRAGRDRIRTLSGDGESAILQLRSGAVFRLAGDAPPRRIEIETELRILDFLEEDAGAFWLGSRLSGLLRISPGRMFRSGGYRDPDGGSVLPIVDHPESGVLVGRLCGGIEHIDAQHRVHRLDPTGPALEHCVWTLHVDADGSVLVGSYDGDVQRLTGDRIRPLRLPLDEHRSGANFLFRDSEDRVWLGADNGLFRIEGDRLFRAPGSPDDMSLLSVIERADGGLLIGTGSGLAVYERGGLRGLETGTRLDLLPVRAMLREDAETLWLGTYGGGLWRHRDGQWFQIGPAHGLVEDVVSCMLVDERGQLWSSGNHGVSRLDLAQLNALADGRRDHVHAWALGEEDGMPNAETNGGGQPACHVDRRGWFWFPTVAGAVAFDPLAVGEFVPAGRVYIESVRLGERLLSPDAAPLALPRDARRLEIHYAAPQFQNVDRLRFRYRLAGLDDDWLEAGTARTIRYPVVPAGDYVFEVQLGVDDGRWLDATAALPISVPGGGWTIRPAWLIAIAAALALLLVSLRWRIAGLRRRDAELNAMIEQRTQKLREMNLRLDEMSRTDELTGIANHRRLRFYLRDQWDACREENAPVTAILVDVDHFKRFNDTFGHQAGDLFLHAMAQSLSARVRAEGGLMARYGGEEFVAVLPRRTLEEGLDIAEALRQAVISLEFHRPDGNSGFVTASFGVASVVPSKGDTPEALIQRADRAMYRAKRGGRDRVCNGRGG